MKEPYSEDLANHTDPESCGAFGNGRREALTGAHAGQPLSCEISLLFRRPTLFTYAEGNIGSIVLSRDVFDSGAVRDPVHAWKLHPGTWEILSVRRPRWSATVGQDDES